MDEVKIEIETAIKTLGLGPDKIRLLNDQDGEKVFRECLIHFVNSGDRRWWWEDFNQPSFMFLDLDKPFEHLIDIIPEPNNKVWLIVEDIYEPFYPIYEALPEIIGDVIGECFGFEYYIIAKDRQWLLCENHHNRLIGIGEILREKNDDKLKVYKTNAQHGFAAIGAYEYIFNSLSLISNWNKVKRQLFKCTY